MEKVGRAPPDVIHVVRDFCQVHAALRRAGARFRAGELRFDEIQELVGDGPDSLLFRLKERCHHRFRRVDESVGREALFDLAVGALFHEAMNLRENFYQQEVYGPQVRALKDRLDTDSEGLFGAFATILGAGAERLKQTFEEVDALLYQTRVELRALLKTHDDDGLVARYLIEHAALVSEVFEEDGAAVLAEVYGSADAAHGLAALSYLDSGFFAEARSVLAEIQQTRAGEFPVAALRAYAEGMCAYLDGRYADAVEQLDRWCESGAEQPRYRLLAHSAAAQIGQLVQGEDGESVAAAAALLAVRLQPPAPGGA